MVVKVVRLEDASQWGVIGALLVDGVFMGVTLELPWKLNQRSISCVPEGVYGLRRRASSKSPTGVTFEVTGVPDRSSILIHPGNTVADTEGCILLGQYPGKLASADRAVLNSGATFAKFMAAMEGVDAAPIFITHA